VNEAHRPFQSVQEAAKLDLATEADWTRKGGRSGSEESKPRIGGTFHTTSLLNAPSKGLRTTVLKPPLSMGMRVPIIRHGRS
jgi:hypothetical protein